MNKRNLLIGIYLVVIGTLFLFDTIHVFEVNGELIVAITLIYAGTASLLEPNIIKNLTSNLYSIKRAANSSGNTRSWIWVGSIMLGAALLLTPEGGIVILVGIFAIPIIAWILIVKRTQHVIKMNMAKFEYAMKDVNAVLRRAADGFDQLPQEKQQQLTILFIGALGIAASSFANSNEHSKSKVADAINHANNLGMGINPSDFL